MLIKSLMDDYCPRRGFRSEHGLCLYTGPRGFAALWSAMGERVRWLSCGMVVEL